MKFSACWIAKNEEKNLARSIESLRDVVDELIVVDTGSEDRTVEIAEGYGAKVYDFEWIGDFSAARNHALEQATGDVIFFLDADEWFSPALGMDSRADIESIFASASGWEAIRLPLLNVNEFDEVTSSFVTARIFLKKPNISYVNRVHERIIKTDGHEIRAVSVNNRWHIHHSGYQRDIIRQKATRNLEMLETALASAPEGDKSRMMLVCYLMREHNIAGRYQEGLPYLLEIMSNPGDLRRTFQEYGQFMYGIIYQSLDLAQSMRHRVSRRQIRERLVMPVSAFFPHYSGTPTIDLVYYNLFDRRDDILLQNLDRALERARKLKESEVSDYKIREAALCYTAARAYWRRVDRIKAMEYAVEPFKSPGNYNGACMHLLLSCIKGQPPEDALMFIKSFIDIENPEALNMLVAVTRLEGFRDLHAYFAKKQIDAGLATNGTFMFLQLVAGNYDASLEFALTLRPETNAEAVRDHLFLLAICADREDVYRDYASGILAPFVPVLEAYFSDTPLLYLTDTDRTLLRRYDLIAFVAGRETADRFLSLFDADPRACYIVKARYLLTNQQYAELAEEDMSFIAYNDVACRTDYIEALLMLGHYHDAYHEIKPLLEEEFVQAGLLNQLLVVAEKAEGHIGKEARKLYDAYLDVFERTTDLRDVANTRITFNDYDRKAVNALRLLNRVNYKKQLEADAALPATSEMLDLCWRCAAIYEEQELYPAALECYRMLVAHDYYMYEESCDGLARMFEKLENKVLASEVAQG